jgi:predicted secreted protein
MFDWIFPSRTGSVAYFALLAALVSAACSRPGSNSAPASSAVSVPSATSTLAPEPQASAAAPAASAAVPAAASAGNPVYGQASHQINSKPGEHFSVLLPASIGTPMKWRIDVAPDSAVLAVLGESYTDAPPSDCADCTGYAGTRRFDFEAKGPGKVPLDFSYRPLTQPKAPAEKQVHIDVSVAP